MAEEKDKKLDKDIKLYIGGKRIMDHMIDDDGVLRISLKTGKSETYIDPIFYTHEDGTVETICSSNKERIKELNLENIEWYG